MIIFLIPFLGALLVPLLGRKYVELNRYVAATALLLSAFFSVTALFVTLNKTVINYSFGGWIAPIGIHWYMDSLSAFMAVLVSVLMFITVLSTATVTKKEVGKPQSVFYMCVLFLHSGLIGMIMTHDLFNFFVFLEVSSLATYPLIATGPSKKASYASFKYLLIGSTGASLYLLGVGYLYGLTGTLNMTDMMHRLSALPHTPVLALAILLITAGLLIKMGLFPFHGWLPDSYTYTSNTVTTLIAPVMTKVAIYAMIRIFFWVIGTDLLESLNIFLILKILSIGGIVAGSFMALRQTKIKRMLAYSSVSHIAFITLAISVHTPAALAAAMLHILFHAVMKGCLFTAVTGIIERHNVTEIDQIATVRGKMPWTFAWMTIAACSMIGLPPFSGFFSKFYLLTSALAGGEPEIALVVVVSGLLTALYMFKLIEQMFFQKGTDNEKVEEANPWLIISDGVLAASILLFSLAAPFLFNWFKIKIFAGVI